MRRPCPEGVVAVLLVGGCESSALAPDEEDPGSLCACAEVDGEERCCNGNGTCEEQDEGPRRCECHEDAAGDTCATPPPGTYPVTPRACTTDDPACVRSYDFVAVARLDGCVDPDGETFGGSIVRPAAGDDGSWPEGPFPLALLVHGASQAFSDYFDLLEHLAANGIVAVSIDGTFAGDPYVRANRLLSSVGCLRSSWPDADRLDDRLALLGHSRGGTAAPLAARAIAQGALDPAPTVAAVVSLAPSLADAISVSVVDTPALLVLQGARDPDSTGAGLAWYDLAGDPAAGDADGLTKSMVWAYGATHHRFHMGLIPANGELEAAIDGPAHWTLARAYIGGFLLWRLLGMDEMRVHFDGEASSPSVAAIWEPDPARVFTQLSEGRRLVIHDFEDEALSPSPVGGEVTTEGLDDATVGALKDSNLPYSQRLRTGGLVVAWPDGDAPRITFALDGPTDATAYAYLGLRMGQPFERAPGEACSAANPPQQPVEITIRTADAEHGEPGVLTAPVPDHFAPETVGNWLDGECQAVDFMRTIRIPLQRYCEAGIDLGAAAAVELSFPGPAGKLVLDDLELTLPPGQTPVGGDCSPP